MVFPLTAAPAERTFLLGVGAQKAGTSWLYKYLSQHPQCQMGPIKEYAAFNVGLRGRDWQAFQLAQVQALRSALGKHATALKGDTTPPGKAEPLLALLDQVAMAEDPETYYLPHFHRLLESAPDARLTGDITPAYSMLGAEDFQRIRALLRRGGFRPRVVFLMRDPVERCYSMMRMSDRNAGKTLMRPAHERFATEAIAPWCEARTRYDHTITALEAAFAPDELYFGFYESFITETGVADLMRFLDLTMVPPRLDRRENASPRSAEPSPEAIASVRAHYAPVYDFCARRFGADVVARHWAHA